MGLPMFAVAYLGVAPLTEDQLLDFISQLVVLLAVARGLGEVFKRLGQPPIIGELLTGIVAGPSLLGIFLPGFYEALFSPNDASLNHILEAFSWVGIILLLMIAGIETDLRVLRQEGRAAMSTALLALIFPFIMGAALAYSIADMPMLNAKLEAPVVFILFLAIMLSLSAVPVIAKILIDLGLMKTSTGVIIISSAVANDTIGWILLSAASGLAVGGAEFGSLVRSLGGTILFLVLAFFVGRPLITFLTGWARQLSSNYQSTTVLLMFTFGLAAITQFIGIHCVLGAFIAGILIGNSPNMEPHAARQVESVTIGFFAPIFFAVAGLKADLTQLFDPGLAALGLAVILVATFGKMLGGSLGAWLSGIPFWQSASIGSGLNARGSMEIIAATVALSLGVITQQLYSIIVIMAVVTSIMAPPLIGWSLTQANKSSKVSSLSQ